MSVLLSVIIPAHNEEKTICRTVDSLVRQDYPDFEIVVVDDGSKDNTGKVLIDQFGFCHGDYFACVDADCTFSTDTLSHLMKALCKGKNIVAVGGRVLPLTGLPDFFHQKGFHLREALQGYSAKELKYGIAFCITHPISDKLGTSMLISGALGLFNKDVVTQLGGYALDTVGEDMELVMRIRRYASENGETLRIVYAKDAKCYTELPWNENDLRKQRIRWTVGLSEVLWKYCEMSAVKKYSFLEKLTFWYYVLFEKFSPHNEFASLIVWIVLGIIDGISQTAIALMATTIILQFLQRLQVHFGFC